MTSSETSEIPRKGRRFTEVWNGHMMKGAQKSRGHYAATCSYCNIHWKEGKPHILREHLANHCKKCPQSVSLDFARIVGKETAENERENESDSESILNPKKTKVK